MTASINLTNKIKCIWKIPLCLYKYRSNQNINTDWYDTHTIWSEPSIYNCLTVLKGIEVDFQ